ncbi:unnamed protein product, partial [Ranitomeya imitator]
MQDNARPHVTGVCQQFLQDEGIEAMDWPARSPDLNPIEHIWDIMSRTIYQRHVAPHCIGVGGCISPDQGFNGMGDNISDIKKHAINQSRHNLTREPMAALRNLETDMSRVFKPSDKGGNVVVMDAEKYRDMCLSILNDRTTYTRVASNPTSNCLKTLGIILGKAKTDRLISEEELSFLLPRHPVMATFYALPKVHKCLDPLRGRPIVSGIGSIGQNIGIYLDDVLRPFVLSLPSYIRDTMDLLRKLEGISLEPGTLLASIDVEALYSSIPHDCDIRGVRHFISARGRQFNAHN